MFQEYLRNAINVIKQTRKKNEVIQFKCPDGSRFDLHFRDMFGYMNKIICYNVESARYSDSESIITENAAKLWGVTIIIHLKDTNDINVSRGFVLQSDMSVIYGLIETELRYDLYEEEKDVCINRTRFRFSVMTTDSLKKIMAIECPFHGISDLPVYAVGYEGDDSFAVIDDNSTLACIDRALVVSNSFTKIF